MLTFGVVGERQQIRTDGAPTGTGASSQAIRAGDLVFVSGLNETYERIFATEPRPARTTTGAELRNILVEIDAVLYLPR
jgi:enamine deaminase RidA (YjgF/YER057c/UK114 family)